MTVKEFMDVLSTQDPDATLIFNYSVSFIMNPSDEICNRKTFNRFFKEETGEDYYSKDELKDKNKDCIVILHN